MKSMYKYIGCVALIVAMLTAYASLPIFAQDLSNAVPDKSMYCLHQRANTTNQVTATANGKEEKTFLYGKFTPGAKKVYTIACTAATIGRACSTGNKEHDTYLFYNQLPLVDTTGLQSVKINQTIASFEDLSTLVNVKFYAPGTSNEKALYEASAETGEIQTDAVITHKASSGTYSFFGIEIQMRNGVEVGVVGQESSLKFGTFAFTTAAEEVEVICASIKWVAPTAVPTPGPTAPPQAAKPVVSGEERAFRREYNARMRDPYGIAFDSKSLEPLPGVVMHILDENKQLVVSPPGLINKWTTLVDGLYNYSLFPGIYYLQIDPPPGYVFEATPQLHANTQSTYVYDDPKTNISCKLYFPNQPIDETTDIQCLNIPLTPLGTPYTAEQSSSMNYDYRADVSEDGKKTPVYVFDGRASHPFTVVTVFQSSKTLGSQTANNAGKYSISIPTSLFAQNADVVIDLAKPNLTGQLSYNSPAHSLFNTLSAWVHTFFRTEVAAEVSHTKIHFDPIPKYIEGYAYDDKNTVIPGAIVNLRYTASKGLAYKSKADKNGYFYIPPSSIPPFNIYLEFESPTTRKTYALKTYEFARLNDAYIKENKINLLTGMKQGVPIVLAQAQQKTAQNDKSAFASKTGNFTNASRESGDTATTSDKKSFSLGPVATTVVIIIVLIVCMLGAGILIMKGQKKGQYPGV